MKYIVQDPEGAPAPATLPPTSHHKLSTPPQGVVVSEGSVRGGRRVWRARVAICVLACGVLALALYTCALLLRDQRRPVICATEQCLHTASRILSSLNRSVSPCEDFYEYACGGWMARNPVPEYASSWDQLATLRERLVHDLRDLLAPANTSEPDPDPEPKPPIVFPRSVLKARALYAACMDVERLEELGTRPITSVLQSLGLSAQVPTVSEPLVEGDQEALAPRTRWEAVAGRARRSLGLSALLSVQVTEDVRNTSRNRLVVEQVSPGFSERYLLGRAHFAHEVAQYRRYIRAVLALADPTLALHEHQLDTATDNILDFSTSLAQIMTPVEVRRSGSHLFHEVSLRQFVTGAQEGPTAWSQHNWTEYLSLVFANTSVTLAWDEDRIIVMDLPYLQKLSVLLHDTPPHVIERFLWWSVFSTLAPMTLAAFRELGFQFSREVFGLRSRTPRWKTCAANVNANFGMALSYLYVRRHFDPDSRDKALEMLEDVREAFGESVRQLQWMDAGTRARTLHKLQAIRTFVGYPEHLLEPKHLDNHYNHTVVVEGELFETYLRLTEGSVRKSLDALRERPDRNRWVAAPTTVNAFYSATLNTVTFPAGILQPPFYGNGIEAINYGSIGAIMGHEITHGFDDQGRRYDAEGNLRQWWSAGTLEHWSERVTCIVQQYGAYRMHALPNMTVHGGNTQGENIADNGGVRAALHAYRRLERRRPQLATLRLPALAHFTPTQLFFLGFAQIWCGNSTAGALKSKLVEGVHSPNRVRVLGALANSAEFAAAFQCAPTAPMNPSNKCLLW